MNKPRSRPPSPSKSLPRYYLLALSDEGAPAYDHDIAYNFAQLDIPAFACTPIFFLSSWLRQSKKKTSICGWRGGDWVVRIE